MNTQFLIAEGMLAKLQTANPTVDPAHFKIVLNLRVRSVEELFKLVPAKSGKWVYLIPMESEFVGRATRGEDRNSYSIGVVAIDILDPPNEHLLNPDHAEQLLAWAKERIAWVKDGIRIPLADPSFAPVTGATCDQWFVNELLDTDMLEAHGIFWSDLDFAYEIDEPNR